MKILINAQLPDNGSGGVLEVVRSMAHGFNFVHNDKFEIHWLLNGNATWWKELNLDSSRIHFIPNIKIKRKQIIKNRNNIFIHFKKLFNKIAFFIGFFDLRIFKLVHNLKPDLIHFPYQQGFFTKLPYIYQIHDMQHKYLKNNFNIFQLFERNFFWKGVSSKAVINLCENIAVADDIQKFYKINKNRIGIIPIPPNQADLFNKTWTGQKSDYLIYPAAFWKHKNHIRLVESFATLGNEFSFLKLVFTGFEHDYVAKVKQKVSDLKIENQVIFKGNLKRNDLINHIQSARLVVIPSLYESYSIPIWEAMMMGVPVIASNIRNVNEQFALRDGYFEPLNIDSISEKIKEFIYNNKVIEKNIMMNKIKLDNFNSINYIKHLIVLYEKAENINILQNKNNYIMNTGING